MSVGSTVLNPISQKMRDSRGLPEYSSSVDPSWVKSYGFITAMLIGSSFNIMNNFFAFDGSLGELFRCEFFSFTS